MLQGKGGVGKTIVASLIAQFYRDKGRDVTCWDADPINASFAGIKTLGATPVPILAGRLLNVPALDGLLNTIITGTTDAVVDSGASSFAPLSDYLLKSHIPDLAADNGCEILAHVVLAGGGSRIDTQSGLVSVLTSYPKSVRVVVWLNEFFGSVTEKPFEETSAYAQYKDRIAGVVTLRHLDPEMEGWSMARMLEQRRTFAEAIEATDLIAKSRLMAVRRDIWCQLEGVV